MKRVMKWLIPNINRCWRDAPLENVDRLVSSMSLKNSNYGIKLKTSIVNLSCRVSIALYRVEIL